MFPFKYQTQRNDCCAGSYCSHDVCVATRLGDMIREAQLGISNNFRADIIAHDESPSSGVDPFSDIRSSYDTRERFIVDYNTAQMKEHKPVTSLTAGTGASVGETGSAAAAAAAAPASVAPADPVV